MRAELEAMLDSFLSAPLTVQIGIGALTVSIALFSAAILSRPRSSRRLLGHLQRGLAAPVVPVVTKRSGRVERLSTRVIPAKRIRTLERLYARAGHPAGWPVPRLLMVKALLPVVIGLLALLYLRETPSLLALLVSVVCVVVGHFLPELLLHSRAQERSQRIAIELADTLDQMTIAVEAGLGFDAAMAKAGRTGRGPLAAELARTLQDIQVGHSRRQAYEALAERTDVTDLRRFIRAVIQAEAYGIGIASILRTQAAELRMKRRQRAEEKAMQIPVKVVFPLMVCILPVLFIVLLGPAAIDIIQAFS